MRRLCGPTFARSQDENSEIASTWWRAAFPARTSATPARAQDSTGSGPACSTTSSEPFATYDPATCSWRTSQPSLFGDWTPFSGRWPKSGLMLAGAAYERPTLARLMAGIAGGASRGTASNWPTITVGDADSGQTEPSSKRMGGAEHESLRVAASQWITPSATEPGGTLDMVDKDGNPPEHFNQRLYPEATGRLVQKGIQHQAAAWAMASARPTPSVADTMGGHLSRGGDRSEELLLPGMAQRVTENWATPSASPWRSGDHSDETWERNSRPLNEQATHWATPNANEDSYRLQGDSQASRMLEPQSRALVDSLSGPLAQPIAGRGRPFSLGGRTLRPQLSALFVEWLMGTPLGMTCVCAIGGTD